MLTRVLRSLLLCFVAIGCLFALVGCGSSNDSDDALAVGFGQIDLTHNTANMPTAAMIFSGEAPTADTYTFARKVTSSSGSTVTIIANSKTGNTIRTLTVRLFLNTASPRKSETIPIFDSTVATFVPPALPYGVATLTTEDTSTDTQRFWTMTSGSVFIKESENTNVQVRLNGLCAANQTIENNTATGEVSPSGSINPGYVAEE